ncbi:hypothetical protein HYZ41_01915 [archaeon]|nr:hypothetical protein [archaeon]
MFSKLTRELYEPDIDPAVARKHLNDSKDASTTYAVAELYNAIPRPPTKVFYDTSLRGTPVLAWYLDPQDVKTVYPREGELIEREIGPDPIIAHNPDILKSKYKDFGKAVDDHEKGHGGQPGKMKLKGLHAMTGYGRIPIGEMLIEGGVEWALEKRYKNAPSRQMDKMANKTTSYGLYRDFVYELEEKSPGIMRQVYRAASKASGRAAGRLLENVPGIEELVNKYAKKLHSFNISMN